MILLVQGHAVDGEPPVSLHCLHLHAARLRLCRPLAPLAGGAAKRSRTGRRTSMCGFRTMAAIPVWTRIFSLRMTTRTRFAAPTTILTNENSSLEPEWEIKPGTRKKRKLLFIDNWKTSLKSRRKWNLEPETEICAWKRVGNIACGHDSQYSTGCSLWFWLFVYTYCKQLAGKAAYVFHGHIWCLFVC